MSNQFKDLSYMKQRVIEDVVTAAVKKQLPQHSSETVEWYTPFDYVDAVKRLFGEIDLDPASCEYANSYIEATKFYTKENSGLKHDWSGKVFLNPPYGGWTGKFVNKLIDSIPRNGGNVTQAILLINSNTSTSYWQRAIKHADCVCFPRKRIAFIDKNGTPRKSPPNSNTFFYFGLYDLQFASVFSDFGVTIKV